MDTPTIDRDCRDALVELMGYRFFVRGDSGLADPGADDEPIARFRDDIQLMTDLAWLPRPWLVELEWPEAEQAEFRLTLEPGRLRRALRRAVDDAREACRSDPNIDEARREVFDRAEKACMEILENQDRNGGRS